MKKNAGILALLIAVVALASALDHRFLDPFNLQNIARWTGMYGILTVGEAFVIISGGIDLSIGSVVGLVGSLLPMMLKGGTPVPLAILSVIALALGIGWMHGMLVAKLRLQPFVVTLCGLFIYRGIARYVTGDATQGFGTGYPELKVLTSAAPLGVPMPFVQLLVIGALAAFVLNRNVFGRYLLAVGGNEEAARLSGVPTERVVIGAYMLSAGLAGIAGVLFAVDINAIQPSGHGNFYELSAIAGAVLGGCSLRGGTGSFFGVILGTAIVRVLYNAINILGIATQLEFAVIGGVILAGAVAEEIIRRATAHRRESARPPT